MEEHECSRDQLQWDTTPVEDGDTVRYTGICICGKVYEQVFTECSHGLWDCDESEYVNM